MLASTILLRSADRNNILLGGDLTRSLGHELMEWEHGDQTMSDSLTNPASMFGNEVLADDNANPMLQFVRAADNGPDQAQGVMSDHERAAYLLNGRLTDESTTSDGEHPATVHGRLGHGSHERSVATGCGHLVLGHRARSRERPAGRVQRGARRDPRHLHA